MSSVSFSCPSRPTGTYVLPPEYHNYAHVNPNKSPLLSEAYVWSCVIDLTLERFHNPKCERNPFSTTTPSVSQIRTSGPLTSRPRQIMAIIARYQRYLYPPPSPAPHQQSQTSGLTELLSSNAHLRAPLPRTDSDNRRQELAKQLAKDDEPVSTRSSTGEDTNYPLAKAVVGRYMEPYLPTIREHKVVLERGVEVVEDSLRRRRGRRGKGVVDSVLSSLGRGIEVEWMIWSRVAPPTVALYAWWALLAIWRKLDDGKRDFLIQLSANKDEVGTWLTWAFAGLVVVLCVLAFVVWAVVEAMRMLSRSGLDPLPSEKNKSTD